MEERAVDRRLAAILAADVAGYSRLMEADEEGTLAALKAHRRELIEPKIAEHRGRLVKTTGDGALVEAIDLNPSFALGHFLLGVAHMLASEPQEAIASCCARCA